ncbi:MAG TPA: Ig-like domain repeat protein [Edaphobacter sp.]|nr:Ig-like domain repeat protein [Edaphobacter sp.]
MGLSRLQSHPSLTARLLTCLWLFLLPTAFEAQTLATNVPLLLPSAIAFDSQGNLYIVETGNQVVRKVDTAGRISTVAGTGAQGYDGDGGPATSALLDSPQGVAVDSSNLYIADTHNHCVRKVDLARGVISTVAGGTVNSLLSRPISIALDSKGRLYVADAGSHQIRRVDLSSGIVTTVAGVGVQGYGGDGAQALSALLDSPQGLAIDTAGNLYLADTHNHRVRRIDTAGAITTVAGSGAFGYAGDSGAAVSARLALPQGLSVDPLGNVYLADSANHRVRLIDAKTGAITTIAGDGTQGFTEDGATPTSTPLDSPRAASISPNGRITVVDTGNARVRQISQGSLQTIAGLGAVVPPGLSIMGPASISYGSGSISATLVSGVDATGPITFVDNFAGSTSVVATVPLTSGLALLDTSQLPAGQHTITASYAGDSSHAAAQSAAFPLVITKAVTATILTVSTAGLVSATSVDAGLPVLLTAHVASATKGTPIGTILVSDGGTLLTAANASIAGDLVFSTSALGMGPHSLYAAYSGDSNFQPSTSPTALFTVNTPPAGAVDFTIAPTGAASRTIVSGASADFTFAVQVQGNLSSPVTLAATGLPDLATASFNPGSITPGSSSASFTMTIATPQTSLLDRIRMPGVFAFLLPLFALRGRRGRLVPKLFVAILICSPLLLVTGCGDRINRGVGGNGGAPTKSYDITVTGTVAGQGGTLIQHTAVVTLVLQAAK